MAEKESGGEWRKKNRVVVVAKVKVEEVRVVAGKKLEELYFRIVIIQPFLRHYRIGIN
jgi:hypothetical protein